MEPSDKQLVLEELSGSDSDIPVTIEIIKYNFIISVSILTSFGYQNHFLLQNVQKECFFTQSISAHNADRR